MHHRFAPLALSIVGCYFSICVVAAEPPPAEQQAPGLRLHVAGVQNMGEARGLSLAVEVSNPGTHALRYHGYRPDSFAPPIPKGQMQPMYQVELKQGGKWQQYPIGWCGTGMDEIEFAPQASAAIIRARAPGVERPRLPGPALGSDSELPPWPRRLDGATGSLIAA